MNIRATYYLIICAMLFASCTSARWMVEDEEAVDTDEYIELSRNYFLQQNEEVTPDHPVLDLEVYTVAEQQFSERVLMQRYIQDYKPNVPFLVMGLSAAATSFYLANSEHAGVQNSAFKSNTLNVIGGVVAVGSILNMKPSGEPRATEEFRYLRQTGLFTENDTSRAGDYNASDALVSISYGDSILVNNSSEEIEDGRLEFNLVGGLNNMEIRDVEFEQVEVSVSFEDSTYEFEFPLDSIMEPYAEVRSQVTELRSEPENSQESVMAELVQGSELQIIDLVDDQWLKVLYGISESYVPISDMRVLWKASDVGQTNPIVTTPIVPFGNIDVESNIPQLSEDDENRNSLIIANENYSEDFFRNTYALRDARLIETYLDNSLGFESDNIFTYEDMDAPSQWEEALGELQNNTADSSQVVVYLNSIGRISGSADDPKAELVLAGQEENEGIDLLELLEAIASVPSDNILVIAELDFREYPDEFTSTEARQLIDQIEESLSEENDRMGVLFSSRFDQPSGIYFDDASEDYKHHIFTYFFAKALQERNTSLSSIINNLQQNVSYTSRRLHDRAQDPVFIGNIDLELVNEE